MSNVFIAFAVDMDKSKTVSTVVCQSVEELTDARNELVSTHGEKCHILTIPDVQAPSGSGALDVAIFNELIAQTNIRRSLGKDMVMC